MTTSKDFLENYKDCPFFSVMKVLTYAFRCVSNAA